MDFSFSFLLYIGWCLYISLIGRVYLFQLGNKAILMWFVLNSKCVLWIVVKLAILPFELLDLRSVRGWLETRFLGNWILTGRVNGFSCGAWSTRSWYWGKRPFFEKTLNPLLTQPRIEFIIIGLRNLSNFDEFCQKSPFCDVER